MLRPVFISDRVLATLVPVPRLEYFPLGKGMAGRAKVEEFYREQYPRFVRHVVAFELLDEWVNQHAALQEYTISLDDKVTVTHRVMSIMPVDQEISSVDDANAKLPTGPPHRFLVSTSESRNLDRYSAVCVT
jgi:hypothetical protein